jgi:hypothetical protein
VVDVKITLAEEDWDALRHEGRSLPEVWSGATDPFSYTYFKASATVNGKTFEDVEVRKKGFLGSLSTLRPSIKIRFDRTVPGRTCFGRKNMTLNNDKQDPSHTHQVMCYALFRKAGCPAPRCNFARVTVNGEDLGVYSHVERIGTDFLARHFKDAGGNLYEGQGADFSTGLVPKFERKTNRVPKDGGKGGPDRSDLDAVVAALKSGDDWLPALAKVVDVEAFLTFWAMEVITGHWDGYAGDRNNFYIYRDPTDGLFHFIPWGADGSFSRDHAFLPGIPKSVYAWSQVAFRFYSDRGTRKLYHARLKALLDEVWDEEALLAEADRIGKLVSPDPGALRGQREFIRTRRKIILAELTGDGPAWIHPPLKKPRRFVKPTPVSGTFSTFWAKTENFLPSPKVTLKLTLGGKPQTFAALLLGAGRMREGERFQENSASVKFYGIRPGKANVFVGLNTVPALFKKGEVRFHGLETCGFVVAHDPARGKFQLLGLIGGGTITFTAAGTKPGDKVAGRFTGLLSATPSDQQAPPPAAGGGNIWKAAADGDLEEVKRLLGEGADINQGDPGFGQTPLAWAVIHDRPKVLAHLLEAGAKPGARSRDGNTPLHSASAFGRAGCAERLLEAGAKAFALNDRGDSPKDVLKADKATTLFIAAVLRVKVDFEKVQAGRKRIAEMLAAKGD